MSSTSSNLKDDKLISVIQVFRHGQKTPTFLYPNDPYKDESYPTAVMEDLTKIRDQDSNLANISQNKPSKDHKFWKDGPGKITEIGMRQCYALGQYTRRRYQEFLPSECLEEHVCCYTTDYERTRLSAKAFIAGFYRPLDGEIWNGNVESQPISPINVNESHFRNLPLDCETYNLNLKIQFKNSFDKIKENYKEIIEYIKQYTGFDVINSLSFFYLYELLFIEDTIGFELPEWTNSVYPKPLKSFAISFMESLTATNQLKRLAVGTFLNSVVEHFEKILEDPTSCQKFVTYSGHDSNIHMTMHTLGYPPHLPSFASSIFFELRKRDNGQAYVNIYFKNEELIPFTLPGGDFNCDLNDFKTLLSTYIIDSDSFIRECSPEGAKE